MRRLVFALAVSVAASATSAAPVPKEKAPSPYGTPVPAEKASAARFDFDRDALTVSLPGDTPPATRRGALPRTGRDVKGDFVAEVRVSCPPPEQFQARWPKYGGGLVVTDPKNADLWVYFGPAVDRLQRAPPEAWARVVTGRLYFPGPNGKRGSGDLERTWRRTGGDETDLRLTRAGAKLTLESRAAGAEEWTTLHEFEAALPETLVLGAAAHNALGGPAEVRFTNLAVRQAAR